jgi:hypothetical protein
MVQLRRGAETIYQRKLFLPTSPSLPWPALRQYILLFHCIQIDRYLCENERRNSLSLVPNCSMTKFLSFSFDLALR